ncbi:hypothetical protein HH214_13975 [Mucilaginibacter robiniae]|uniref:Uncharacterized protein n=1 Tax=Mucilaginibacter robiniae TaxID=2728022 RepID=A0A7L5E0J7_9SPHI|nr:hypothetical protein [Mucilaginibacter robiniae]QJD96900.1 hypothetical protein HH214_13975 [Mucilaginibacter robiniae]
MNMQDDELDELFRSGLTGMQVEPSAKVWQNISTKLDGQHKKQGMPWLNIAASILVVLTAGIWFVVKQPNSQQNQVNRHYAAQPKAATNTGSSVLSPLHSVAKGVKQPLIIAANKLAVNHKKYLKQLMGKKVITVVKPLTAVKESQPAELLAANYIAAEKPVVIITPVLPEAPLVAKTITEEAPVFKPVDVTVTGPAMVHQSEKKVHKHSIRSLGDVINVLVSQVDKREDKIIEFTDTDDDHADITGINLGIIKVKKEK